MTMRFVLYQSVSQGKAVEFYCTTKTETMQRIQDCVSRCGCRFYVAGTVALTRFQAVRAKFADSYETGLTRHQIRRRKEGGCAVTYVVWWWNKTEVRFWLLITPGRGAIWRLETPLALGERGSRLKINGDYELLLLSRAAASGGDESWTWRLDAPSFEQWRNRLSRSVIVHPKNPARLSQSLYSLYRMPGFRGIRQQVGLLVGDARRQWRSRYSHADFPETPGLGYVSRIKAEIQDASAFLQQCINSHARQAIAEALRMNHET